MNPVTPRVAVLLTTTFIFIAGVVVVLGLDLIRKVRGPGHPKAPARQESATPRNARALIWVFLMFLVAFLVWASPPSARDRNRPAPPPRPPVERWAFALVLGTLAVVVLVAYVRAYRKSYDRDVSMAMKKASSGDGAGAIEDLRAAIAPRGPSALKLNGLGVLLGVGGDWIAALLVLREAFALNPGLVRGNLAVAAWKSGDLDEAVGVITPLVEGKNPQPMNLLHCGLMLLDLGRPDEAEERIDLAETTLRKTYYLGAGDTKATLLAEIAAASARIAGLRGVKKDLDGLEEL